MSKEITIAGLTATVTTPYVEGHQVTEAEAKALNQVRSENIRNNLAKQAKEALEAAEGDKEAASKAFAATVAAYDEEYEFTLASVGGGTKLDPIEREARAIARDYISAQLKEKGITQKAYKEANGEDSIKEKIAEFAAHPKIIEMAKKAMAEREKNAKVTEELAL